MSRETEALQWIIDYAEKPKYANQDGTINHNTKLLENVIIIKDALTTKEELKETISKIYQIAREWSDDIHADGNDSMQKIVKILED